MLCLCRSSVLVRQGLIQRDPLRRSEIYRKHIINSLWPSDGNKLLPVPMLTSHQYGQIAFIWCIRRSGDTNQWYMIENCMPKILFKSPRPQWVNSLAPWKYGINIYRIKMVLWHPPENNFTRNLHRLNLKHVFRNYALNITAESPRGQWVNSLEPSDAVWHSRSWSTLVQVMACCLTAPSHYLNQCWLIISKVLWHSSEDIIVRWFEDTDQ